MNVLLDTNILARAVEPAHKDHRAAVDSVAALRGRGDTPCLVPQNFYEFWVVSTRPLANNGRGRTPAEVAAEFAHLRTQFAVLDDVPAVFDAWLALVTQFNVSGKPAHDARLVAAMTVHGLTHLLTFNAADFTRYPGITVLAPAAVAATPPTPGHPMTGELVVVSKAEAPVRLGAASVLPVAIRQAGPKAEEKFLEFFAVTIRNVNTRMAYLRAVTKFFSWVETNRLRLDQIRPLHVAAYIEGLTRTVSAPTVKQNLAAVRMLFDFLIVNQVVETNPAAAVRGPSHSAKKGKTPVLDQDEARQLLDRIDTTSVVGLRDRAVIGLMVYTFARVGALVAMNVEDYYPQGKRWWVRLHEKGGKMHDVPAHHKLEEYLDAYLDRANLRDQKKGPLFRVALGKKKALAVRRLTRRDVYEMVRRRAKDADIATAIRCHSFRATGITNYLVNGGTLEKAQQLANHESARTTKLYDRRDDKLSLDEVERITI